MTPSMLTLPITSLAAAFATKQQHQICVHVHSSPTQNADSCTTPCLKKRRRVKFVPWAGKHGMLPHQYYSGILNSEEYQYWLRIPLNKSSRYPMSAVQNYFSSKTSTSGNVPRIRLPSIQPRHLRPIYVDEHIIVVNKPSGVLSVPGPRRHDCIASLAYRYFGKTESERDGICQTLDERNVVMDEHGTNPSILDDDACNQSRIVVNKQIDTMIVHRLDRDTSGVLIFARNDHALKRLHNDFKDKTCQRVTKKYVALVCGHWEGQPKPVNGMAINEGEIDLPLVRDMDNPPFMCVATEETRSRQEELKRQSPRHQQSSTIDNQGQIHNHPGYLRMVGKEAKASLTTFRILSYEYLIDNSLTTTAGDDNDNNSSIKSSAPKLLPITRVELTPVTGRTHQLRVHCAAVGHPIVGDSIYGYNGEGAPRGGLGYCTNNDALGGACLNLQRDIYNYWMKYQEGKCAEEDIREYYANSSDGDDTEIGLDDECMLCLHAYQLSIFHPLTEAPMMFECDPSF